MRLLFYSLLILLPFMGFALNAAVTCECPQPEHTTEGIEATPCCQDAPADCCVQQNRDVEPQQPLYGVVPAVDSLNLTLTAISTLADHRTLLRPQPGIATKRARPPPRPSSEHRCQLQSWLI
ncbi:MAG: hypothetical protein ACI9JZ_003053 [Lentimonas sp.]